VVGASGLPNPTAFYRALTDQAGLIGIIVKPHDVKPKRPFYEGLGPEAGSSQTFHAKLNSRRWNYIIVCSLLTDGTGGFHTIMEPRTLHILELTAATIGQTVLLAAAWGFFGAVFDHDPLIVPDSLATLIFRNPTETTWIVTLMATLLSIATTTYDFVKVLRKYPSCWFILPSFLSIAFKEALRRRMHKPISLIHLSGGIALARNSFFFSFRHLIPTVATLMVFGVTKLLVSRYATCSVLQEMKMTLHSWAALLAPALVPLTAGASGWELDLTSNSFESMLRQELVQSGAAVGNVGSLKSRHGHSHSN